MIPQEADQTHIEYGFPVEKLDINLLNKLHGNFTYHRQSMSRDFILIYCSFYMTLLDEKLIIKYALVVLDVASR